MTKFFKKIPPVPAERRVAVKRCDVRGKRCIAVDKKNAKWKFDVHSEYEADKIAEAVEERGWIDNKLWSLA